MAMGLSSAVFRLHLLLLLACLVSQLLTGGFATEIQRPQKKRMQRPAFLFDAWGKRDASQEPLWRLVGEDEDNYLFVVPKVGFNSAAVNMEDEAENPFELRRAVSKRGAYLDLPWG
ncbi:hypothetical protein ECG_04513 [Echinococcus granulosus]|uniref:Expressed conserved protein n=1 Tax=Echinococcus granulosus TaxID=6210 RepID=U6J650_ECHGR|nr:hypothetical protein EGR_00967 [Echinococcus granulosus]EUB64423.1 hypothetical protein EGR_00967 [Echinococcus granulosus]KAH9283202.1 hypothetical protein ECG_04513 [Echinococcus granulosus]CDS17203.1 expressed conserved protein [Echinococcus granulosus]